MNTSISRSTCTNSRLPFLPMRASKGRRSMVNSSGNFQSASGAGPLLRTQVVALQFGWEFKNQHSGREISGLNPDELLICSLPIALKYDFGKILC